VEVRDVTDDGRILALGALGALVLGSAARGSAAVARELPVFALSGSFLELALDAPRLRSKISEETSRRRGRPFTAGDMRVQVTPEDWQKLQAAHRLLPSVDERERHLTALQAGGKVSPEGLALIAKLRKDSAEQKALVHALLASLRAEIVERSRGKSGSSARAHIPGLRTMTIPKGTRLYHGTQAEESFRIPNGPAFFSDNEAVAHEFVDWHEAGGPRRVLTYRVTRPISRLWRIEGKTDMVALIQRIEEETGSESGLSGSEMAESVCDAAYGKWNGWNIPNNYDNGSDTMLCDPERWLAFEREELL
jgi:hypothetical protein